MPAHRKSAKPRVSYNRDGSTYTIRVSGKLPLTAKDLWTGLLPLDNEPVGASQPIYVLDGFNPGHFEGWKREDLHPFEDLLEDLEPKAGKPSFWDLIDVGGQPASHERFQELMASESGQVRTLAFEWMAPRIPPGPAER